MEHGSVGTFLHYRLAIKEAIKLYLEYEALIYDILIRLSRFPLTILKIGQFGGLFALCI